MFNKVSFYKNVAFAIILSLCSANVAGQEYLHGIESNVQIKKELVKYPFLKEKIAPHTLALPFIDDFSLLSIFPDAAKWLNQSVYINDDYAINQPTIGVATFDAIDYKGDLYAFSDTANVMPGDTLTSQLIDLSNFVPADSVYLSFYVQGGGLGNKPQTKDSLILQFRDSTGGSSEWKTIWSKEGEAMTHFIPVVLPLTNGVFFHDSAQFRFINFFSLEYAAMNCDHWNIDYVVLDKNRSVNDSLINEVAYTKNINSLLNTFSSVPWSHFNIYYAQIVNEISYKFHNYTNNVMNITPYFRWTNLYTQEVENVGNIANNYAPHTSYTIDKPINSSLFSLNESDSARFLVQNRFYISENDYAPNNVTNRFIDFYNYYAYDDGSAEGMYGVSNKYGMVAVKFNVFRADSLKAVRIYFNKSLNGENRYFNIMVWDDGGSGPGEVLYSKTRNLPSYADSINGFVTIQFDSAISIDKVFYVGWQKITDQRLNMGFDKNFISYQKNYFNANGRWELSEYSGSLMIRPVLGDMYAYKDSFGLFDDDDASSNIFYQLYPNPLRDQDQLHITSKLPVDQIQIFNQLGVLVYQDNNTNVIDIYGFPVGMYIVRISDGERYYSYKIIKK